MLRGCARNLFLLAYFLFLEKKKVRQFQSQNINYLNMPTFISKCASSWVSLVQVMHPKFFSFFFFQEKIKLWIILSYVILCIIEKYKECT